MIVLLLGIVTCLMAAAVLIKPESTFDFVRKHFLSTRFQYGVGILSLILAVAIYYASPELKFPRLFEIIALMSLAGGVIVFALPPADFKGLISWELRIVAPYSRILGIWYILIGGFLVYVAI